MNSRAELFENHAKKAFRTEVATLVTTVTFMDGYSDCSSFPPFPLLALSVDFDRALEIPGKLELHYRDTVPRPGPGSCISAKC